MSILNSCHLNQVYWKSLCYLFKIQSWAFESCFCLKFRLWYQIFNEILETNEWVCLILMNYCLVENDRNILKWHKWFSSWLSWNYYSIVIFNFMKWLWVWIVDSDSENDRNIKQEKYDIEWTWVCWLGSSHWYNLLYSSIYVGSKGSATCELFYTLLKS